MSSKLLDLLFVVLIVPPYYVGVGLKLVLIVLADRFRPKWKRSSSLVRRAAVRALTDQRALAQVVKRDTWPDIRKAAVRRIDSQSVLEDVARGDKEPFVREAAVERLTDQRLIARTTTPVQPTSTSATTPTAATATSACPPSPRISRVPNGLTPVGKSKGCAKHSIRTAQPGG
jgi:hypothetical protein